MIKNGFIKNIRTNTEYTLAKGGMFFKPFYANGKIKISCIQGDKFIPTKFDSTGELLGAIFIDQITKGEDLYTRLEYQELNDTTITIKNIAYKGKKNTSALGSKVSLASIPEWKEIQEETYIENVNRLLGGYFKIPIANQSDNTSPVGVPIFANAIGTLEEIDRQFSRTLWEYEGSELAIDIDELMLKKDKKGNEIYPKGKDRLYRKLDLDGDKTNLSLYNLHCITRKQLMKMNQNDITVASIAKVRDKSPEESIAEFEAEQAKEEKEKGEGKTE